jgi:hypothetical protein
MDFGRGFYLSLERYPKQLVIKTQRLLGELRVIGKTILEEQGS